MSQTCPSPGAHQTLSFSVTQLSTERQPKPGGENSLLWTGSQWGRWLAQIESHEWVDKIGLCAGLQNSCSSSSSHRKGDPEDIVLLCANDRWCKYSLCASPWYKCNWPSETLQGAWDAMCHLNPAWTAAEKHCNTTKNQGINSEALKKVKWWIGKAFRILPNTKLRFYFQMYHIIGKRHGSLMFLLEKLELYVIFRNSMCRCSPDINKCLSINCMRGNFFSKHFIFWFIQHLSCCLSTF